MKDNFTDAMIDIESLDTRETAVVPSIGIVLFDPFGSAADIKTVMYAKLNVDHQLSMGRTVSWSTISFWLEQDDRARESLRTGGASMSVAEVSTKLKSIMDQSRSVWGNSPKFDLSLLENLIPDFKSEHYKEMDFRTLRKTYQAVTGRSIYDEEREWFNAFTAHNPLDDAIMQARRVQIMNNVLSGAYAGTEEKE